MLSLAECLAFTVAAYWGTMRFLGGRQLPDGVLYGLLFCLYVGIHCIVVFNDAAMLTAARARLEGGNPTFLSALRAAFRRLWGILAWAVLAATVGLLIAAIQKRLGTAATWVDDMVDAAWDVITYFAVPVMVFEGAGPLTAVERSREIVRRTWGESLAGHVGLSAAQQAFGFVGIVCFGVFLYGATLVKTSSPQVVWLGLGGLGLYLLTVGITFSALEQIYRAAIYVFAMTGSIPSEFADADVRGAMAPGLAPEVASLDQVVCPGCHEGMNRRQVNGVVLDLCNQCGGMWLEPGEPERLLKLRPLPRMLRMPQARLEACLVPEGSRRCQACQRALRLESIEGVRVDTCSACGGLFLDRGELGQLENKLVQGRLCE
ncbi:MAG: DUF6159 family protein [Candidatus Eremiobacterota bacterium]